MGLAHAILVCLALLAFTSLQGCLPPDWSFCDCDFRDNFWDSILNDIHLLWDGPDFVRRARDNSTFQGRYLQAPPADLNCPVSPTVFWKAWPQYGITRGLIEGSMGDLWMPGARDRFKQVCIAGHLALMAICSQHFLVKAARLQEAGDPDHMKWLEASYGHMVAIRNLGQAYQIRQCMGQQGWSLDVGAFHRYTERWIGREAEGTTPQAAFLNGKVDPWQMLFTKPMRHTSESRAAALPDRRVCVPFKDPACWKRKSLLLIETCEYCCNPFEHKSGRGASWCWDDEWTYERCCQQDYKDLVCEVRRKGEEGGCVDCKKSVTYACMTPPEKRLQDAQNNYNTKVDLFNSLQDKARTLAQDIAATRTDVIGKDGIYRELHADLNTKLRTWHVAINNASRLSSVARLEQQQMTWNSSKLALQQAETTLRSSQAAVSSARNTLLEARKLEQMGRQLLANNESSYEKAKSHHAAMEKALSVSKDKQRSAEKAADEAQELLEASIRSASAAFDMSMDANNSRSAIYANTSRKLEDATSFRDSLRAQTLKTLSTQQPAATRRSLSQMQAARVCRHNLAVADSTVTARVRSAQQSVKEAQASRQRSAEALDAAASSEELVHQAIANCTGSSEGTAAMQCLIATTPANKSAKPLVPKSSWQKELCSTWRSCEDGDRCGCTADCANSDVLQVSETQINSLAQHLLDEYRLAAEALARKKSVESDEGSVYVPPELVTAMEGAAKHVTTAKEKQAAAAKASRDAQSTFERAKANHEAIDKRQRSAQAKLLETQSQEKDLTEQLAAAEQDLQQNVTLMRKLNQILVEANRTAQHAADIVMAATDKEASTKVFYAELVQDVQLKRQQERQATQRRSEANDHVQALNQSLADNLTVLVSAWLRQQETASQASHSARWSERLLSAAKAVLVNMVGSFESFLENYVISISDKDAAMRVMRAVENLKAVELTALEAEKTAQDAAEEVRHAEASMADAEAAKATAERNAVNATSRLVDAQDVALAAEIQLNRTRAIMDRLQQRLPEVKSFVQKWKAEADAAADDKSKADAAVKRELEHVRAAERNLETADAHVARAIADHTAAEARVAKAKETSVGSSLLAAKRECQPTEQEFQVYLHFRAHLGLAKHVVVQRLSLRQLADKNLQREELALQETQVVQEALQDSVLDAGAADDQNAVASAAADADLHLQQAQADRLATELSDGTDRFRMAQEDVSELLKMRSEAYMSSVNLATAYMTATSKRETAESNLFRRRQELEAAKNHSLQVAADLVKSVDAEAEAKKSAEAAKDWQLSFNRSLQIERKEGILGEAQEDQKRCEMAEAKASQREARMRSLLNTHKRHLLLCDLQVELPEKEQKRSEAKAAFDKAEKDLLEAQTKLESLASDEAETHSKIEQTYQELQDLKQEHSKAEKEYNDQDPEDRKRSFTTSLQGSGA